MINFKISYYNIDLEIIQKKLNDYEKIFNIINQKDEINKGNFINLKFTLL